MGHNYYGEPAWPNDILFIFLVVIFNVITCLLGLVILEPLSLNDRSNPFNTPLEILPEWYFFPTFNLLRIVFDKPSGILSLLVSLVALLLTFFIENISIYQNSFRRLLASLITIIITIYSCWLNIGSLLEVWFGEIILLYINDL